MVKLRRLTWCTEERKVGLSKSHFRKRNFDISINCKLKVIFSQNCLFNLCVQMFFRIYPNPTVPQSTSMSDKISRGKPFCMEPQNSSACKAGFFFSKHSMKVEPCPDGKLVVP